MRKRNKPFIYFILFAFLFGSLLTACGSGNSTPTSVSLDGATLMQERCSVCHSIGRVTSAHKTIDQWKTSVDRMIARGAQLTPAEEQVLLGYLAANYK